MSAVIQNLVNQPYKHGFRTEIEADTVAKGLNEDVIRTISAKKNGPCADPGREAGAGSRGIPGQMRS